MTPFQIAVLESVREALREHRKEFWDEWHAYMSEGDFENHDLIMGIDKHIRQLDEIIGGKE